MHFNSISGGTDIVDASLADPDPTSVCGRSARSSFSMKVKAYDETGNRVVDEEGELVCEAPSPSMPLYFLNDPFGEIQGSVFQCLSQVWRHGDRIIFHGDTGGITFLGRFDFTLKPFGVRIGPAEIYNVVENIDIADSLAVGQNWGGDQRIILFVSCGKMNCQRT